MSPAPRTPTQGTTVVARAEVRRLLRQGGILTGLGIAVVLGLVSGLGSSIAVRSTRTDASGAWLVATPTSVAALVAALTIAFAVSLRFGADARNGTLATTLVLVPDRRRLVVAQSVAVACVAAGTVASVAFLAGSIATTLNDDAAHTGSAVLVGTFAGAASAALLAVLALAAALSTRHPAAATLTLAAWWVVLPMALAAVRVFLPGPLSATAHFLLVSSPPMLAAEAAHPGTLQGVSVTSLVLGLLGLALWVGVLVTGAHALLVRRSVRERDEPGRRLVAG